MVTFDQDTLVQHGVFLGHIQNQIDALRSHLEALQF
jgi:hypothetical protein